MLYKLFVPLPLILATIYYGHIYLNSPIPPDPNSPALFLSALQGEPNLLSQLIRVMLLAPPSTIAFTLVIISIAALYIASYIVGRQLRLGHIASLLPPSLLLVFPHITYTASSGLSVELLPAGIASLGLSVSYLGARKFVAAGLGCIILSAFINPDYSIAVGLTVLAWVVIKSIALERNDFPLKHLLLAFNSLLGSAVGFSMIVPPNSLPSTPDFLHFQQQPILYVLLFATTAAGFFLLATWRKEVSMAIWLASWAAATPIVGGLTETLLFLTVPFAILTSILFVYGTRRIITIKGGGEERKDREVENIIEIDIPKLSILVLVVMFILSSLSVTVENLTSRDYMKAINSNDFHDIVTYLKDRNSSIVAPSSILPWLSIYSGQRPPLATPQIIDSWVDTSFRIQNGYVRVDEWQPFSASRSPRVAIIDGRVFTYFFYVDDSYVRFMIRKDNSNWIESPYGMAFLGWKWLNDFAVELTFQSRWLLIRKTIEVNNNSVTITYAFSTMKMAQVDRAEISVFAEWPFTIESFKGDGPLFFLTIRGKTFSITTQEGSTSKYLTEGVPRVVITKSYGSASGILSLKFDCLNAEYSFVPPHRASIFDYFAIPGEKYLVSVKSNPDRFRNVTNSYLPIIYFVDAYNSVKFKTPSIASFVLADSYVRFSFYTYTNETAPILYVVDSYIKANFLSQDSFYSEALSGGKVLNESYPQPGSRVVTYETSGLIIDKVILTSRSSVSFDYRFRAKSGEKITAVEGLIWLPRGMNYTYTHGKGYILLRTPMGLFNITHGRLNASVGPYGEGGQPSIRIYGSDDRLLFTINSIQPIYLEYFPTSRPLMNGSDIVRLSSPYLMGPWVESPAGAHVVSRNSSKWIAKTKALTFEKQIKIVEGGVDIIYNASPNNGSNAVIIGGWSLVWLNLDISRVKHSSIPNGLRVENFNITGGPLTSGASLGVLENGALYLNITFSDRDLAVMFRGNLNLTHQPSKGVLLDDIIVLDGYLHYFYEESPSNAQVLRDVYESYAGLREIIYRTGGLDFVKIVRTIDITSISITYQVKAKSTQTIIECRAYIWIPWNTFILNYSINGPLINVDLDIGSFSININPAPRNVSFVPEPQPAFLLSYEIDQLDVFSYTITIFSSRPLSITYQEGGRPVQESSDVLIVNALFSYLQLEHETNNHKIYKVVYEDS